MKYDQLLPKRLGVTLRNLLNNWFGKSHMRRQNSRAARGESAAPVKDKDKWGKGRSSLKQQKVIRRSSS